MERTKHAWSSVSNKAASKICTTLCWEINRENTIWIIQCVKAGKGACKSLSPKNKNYLWCGNEIMELKESSIFALWRHSHSYPPSFFFLALLFPHLDHYIFSIKISDVPKTFPTALLREQKPVRDVQDHGVCYWKGTSRHPAGEADPPGGRRCYSPMATGISTNVKWLCEKKKTNHKVNLYFAHLILNHVTPFQAHTFISVWILV